MAKPVNNNSLELDSSLLHLVVINAGDASASAPLDFEQTTVNTWLAEGVYFAEVATGAGVQVSDGNTFENVVGQTNILDILDAGNFSAAGLDTAESKAIFDWINGQDCHVAVLIAPENRTNAARDAVEAEVGDRLVIYQKEKVFMKEIPAVYGQPSQANITFSKRKSAKARALDVYEAVIADIP